MQFSEIVCDPDVANNSTIAISRNSDKRGSRKSQKSLALNLPTDPVQRNTSGDSSSPSSPGAAHPVFRNQRSYTAGSSFRSNRTMDEDEMTEYPIDDDELFEESIRKREVSIYSS